MNTLGWKRVRILIFRTLFILLALIGAFGAVIHCLMWWGRSGIPGDAVVSDTWPSPDGSNKAIRFILAGGGGFSPYCIDRVSVVASEVSDREAWGERSNVFTAGCGSLKSVTWKSNDSLQIAFDPTVGAQGANLTIKGFADGGQIKLLYVFQGR